MRLLGKAAQAHALARAAGGNLLSKTLSTKPCGLLGKSARALALVRARPEVFKWSSPFGGSNAPVTLFFKAAGRWEAELL